MGNEVMYQSFEWYLEDDGKFFSKLKDEIKDLKNSGIDAIWLPPVFKATSTNDVGYGVYDLYDLGEFDQKGSVRSKYGKVNELKSLIEEIHKNGMKVYMDVVMNHKAGADKTEVFRAVEVDKNDRNNIISEEHDIKAWTYFDFPGRCGKYSQFIWNFQHFTGVDYDEETGKNGIFKICGDGKNWSENVASENGNFDYLMFADIDLNNSDVRDELFRWADWFTDYLQIDGMRFDALKHMDASFVRDFIKHLCENGKDHLYYFGEYWENNLNHDDRFLFETKYKLDIFDVTLHFNLSEASKKGKDYDLRKIFDGSIVKNHPLMAVTFVDNHDSEPGQSLESFVDPWFKKIAYGLILLRKDGYPCVFYGDYKGIKAKNISGQKDMIDNLIDIRKKYAYGDEDNYFESQNLIGWVRRGVKITQEG